MLLQLQQQLTEIYQVDRGQDVRDFLITDPVLAKYLGKDALFSDTDETLLVSQEDDGLAVSLFLDGDMLERLENSCTLDSIRADSLDDLWKVLEGISHFVCVAWKAAQDRTVTLFELELQGEIDKFISTMVLALRQSDRELVSGLHGWLFEDVRFHGDLDNEQLERYRSANDLASRYCHGLGRRLIGGDDLAMDELRSFYRLQVPEKISHIHTAALS